MLRTKRVTDTLQTLFFLNNNISRFLRNERAFKKKKTSKCFFFFFFLKKINTAVSFLTQISGAVSSQLCRPMPGHTVTEAPHWGCCARGFPPKLGRPPCTQPP